MAEAAAAAARALRAVLSVAVLPWTSYVHPDEHFQCGEVAASWVFSSGAAAAGGAGNRTWNLPWEFADEEKRPFRSRVAPWVQCGVPLTVLKSVVGEDVSGAWLLAGIRVWGLAMAGGVGDVVAREVFREAGLDVDRACLVRAWSWVALVLLPRSFSNSLEALLLDVLLWLALVSVKRPAAAAAPTAAALTALAGGAVVCLGCFVRITFPAFAGPVVVWTVVNLFVEQPLQYRMGVVLKFVAWASVGFLACGVWCLWLDSWSLAPLNNLRYNLDSDNLAVHGLHARWTHVVVNMPLMFGPLCAMAPQGAWRHRRRREEMLALGVVLTSLLVLSAFPHQEARFLTPLLVPMVMLSSSRISNTHVVMVVVFNLVSALFWGVWHQGGVVGGLLAVPSSPPPSCVIGVGVYSLPTYLLGTRSTSVVIDVGSQYSDLAALRAVASSDSRCGHDALVVTTMGVARELWDQRQNWWWHDPLHFNGERASGGGVVGAWLYPPG